MVCRIPPEKVWKNIPIGLATVFHVEYIASAFTEEGKGSLATWAGSKASGCWFAATPIIEW
jgi:hypothetical protein